jgi:hypothetical protein
MPPLARPLSSDSCCLLPLPPKTPLPAILHQCDNRTMGLQAVPLQGLEPREARLRHRACRPPTRHINTQEHTHVHTHVHTHTGVNVHIDT